MERGERESAFEIKEFLVIPARDNTFNFGTNSHFAISSLNQINMQIHYY